MGQRYEGVSLLAAAAQRCPFTEEFSETKKALIGVGLCTNMPVAIS